MTKLISVNKRILSFIMALLMTFTSFIYMEMPTTEAAMNLTLDSNNWRGWYENYVHPAVTTSNYQGMMNFGLNPLSVSGGQIVSSDRHTAAGYDDFVAVASNGHTPPGGYNITVNIRTGYNAFGDSAYDPYISDGGGNGAFCIGIMKTNTPGGTAFATGYWAYGVIYGFYDTNGYTLTFKADAGSKNYYDRCIIYKASTNAVAEVDLPANLVMANGTADTNVKLVENNGNYDIVISNSNGLEKNIYTITDFERDQDLYYGVGAFCCSQNGGAYIQTSPGFIVKSVGDCKGTYSPADFTGGNHKIVGEELTNYYLESCSVCGYANAKRYSITYDANGGSGAPSDTAKAYTCSGNAEAKATYTVSSTTPTRSGYTFGGWKAVSNDSEINGKIYQAGASIKTGYNLKLVAQWGETTYTLTLNPNGGTMPSGYSTTYTFRPDEKLSDIIGGFPEPSRTGYTFNGWKFTTTGEHWTDGWGTQPYTWGQNITVTAQWIANTYTVDFDVNGNTQITFDGQPITVTFGKAYGTLPSISRVGYTFNGWYTAASGGTEVTASTVYNIAGDSTLYAHWTAKSYTLTFALDGGTQASGYSTTYTFKQDQKFVDVIGGYPAPIKRGYLFDGWKNLATGEHWTGGWGTQPYTYGANVTLTAQWVEDPDFKPYYLIFDVNGGNMTSDHATVYGIDTGDKYADIIGTIPTAEKTGYTFGGWYSSKYNYTLGINDTFTAAEDVTLVAQWTPVQSVVTLDLNDAAGTKASCSVTSITVSYGSTYSALPTPTRTGYTFNGWYTAASGGSRITTSTTVSITSAQTLYAHWTANSYTLTFELQGGTMPSGYKESYTFLADQSFNTVIGGFPIPTRAGYDFLGWQWTNHTDHYWKTGWGTQIFYFGQNITVYARWQAQTYTVTFDKNATDAAITTTSKTVTYGKQYGELPTPTRGEEYEFDGWYTAASGGTKVTDTTTVTATADHTLYAHWLDAASYTVSFNSDGYINVQKYGVSQQVKVSDTSLPGGGTTSSFKISRDQTFASAVGDNAYFPTHNLWTFVGWLAVYNDSNGNAASIILSSDNWTTAVFDGTSDITCTAYYICQHSRFSNAISKWEENASTGNRVIGKCRVCGFDGAYGYRVNFLARYNNEADILLSYGVPQDELFTYENCLYDSTNGIIIDFLDIKTSHPTITIQFNPVLIAAHDRDAGWLGWSIDGKDLTPQKHTQIIFDQDNDEWNHHLNLRSEYESGYYEIVFNAGNGLKGEAVSTAYPNNGVIVDMNRRYGVIAIRSNESYHSVLNYVPQAKHIGVYNYPDPITNPYANPICFDNGSFYYYSNGASTLYVSIGWTDSNNLSGATDPQKTASMMNAWHGGQVLNSSTCHNTYGLTKDIQMSPWYFSQPKFDDSGEAVMDDGVSQGYLTTFYANNKGASADYSKAYYDPDEKSGGTMYYMYTKNGSGSYTCTPVFGFLRSDYEGNSKVFIFEPDSQAEYIADFNITVYDKAGYFDTYDYIIAKEPKRYTYYLGEGDHYVFPTVVADPAGVAYEPYEKENGFDYYKVDAQGNKVYYGNIKDPGYDLITDSNGNTYYNSLPGNKFKLSRTSNGVPVCNLYTQNATWAGYNVVGGTLPLGFPGISYYLGGNKALYTPVQPHGNAQTYFVTAIDYQDYGNMYGAGIPMSYPEGNQYVSMYPALSSKNLPMQACYYTQWDFEVEFNSNYPSGQEHDDDLGYPTSLPSGNTANVDDNGNHYVYSFFDSFSDTPSLNNKMFTCDDYVLEGWQLYNQKGDPVIYDHDYNNATPGEYLIIDTIDKMPSEPKGLSQTESMSFRNDYMVTIYDAYLYARAPGCEFRAIWKRVYDYTLIEDQAGYGANTFAKIKYKDKFEVVHENVSVTETTTFQVYPDTEITVSGIAAASNYTYCFLSLNVEKQPELAGRLITNSTGYTFTIVSDTTMSAVFRPNSKLGTAILDRSNQLLVKLTNRLYKSDKSYRTYVEVNEGAPEYTFYKQGSATYTVTVSGSTFSEANTTYTKHYDELITLMTDAKGFKGWQVDGKFVSFDPVFDYRVTGNATVTAVYSGTAGPSISISTVASNDDSREAVIITHAAPEGYELVEAGVLISDSSVTFVTNETTDDISNNTYTKIVSANELTDGSFKLMLPKGTRYYAGYAVYYDKNNKIVKVISDTKQQ